MLQPDLFPEAKDCLQSQVGLHSPMDSCSGSLLQRTADCVAVWGCVWLCVAVCGCATNGCASGGSQPVWASGNRTASLEPTAVPEKEAQICVLSLCLY